MRVEKPKTEEELKKEEQERLEARLLPKGEYSFQVSSAEDTQSKKGNDMIALELRVYKPDGTFNLVRDWLVEAMAFKVRHFCDAVGIIDQYEAGKIKTDELQGKTGMLILDVEDDEKYGKQNRIKDYIPGESAEIPKNALEKTIDPDLEDDIPF